MKKQPIPAAVPQPVGGIYFVAPFPEGWEVCAFPFARYPDSGHALIWEHAVAPQLALQWARKLYTPALLDREPDRVTQMIGQLANLYDGVPRGRAQTPPDQSSRCIVYHGDDLIPGMEITRREILKGLLLPATTHWESDDHETQNPDSAHRLRRVLKLPVRPNYAQHPPLRWPREE
jgi:hypothetical protein